MGKVRNDLLKDQNMMFLKDVMFGVGYIVVNKNIVW